jgi:predicted secreted protein
VKHCTKCGIEFPLTEEFFGKTAGRGFDSRCRSCERTRKLAAANAWRKKNPVAARERSKKSYYKNRETRLAEMSEYRTGKNRPRWLAAKKRYNQKNAEKLSADKHARYIANPTPHLEYARLYRKTHKKQIKEYMKEWLNRGSNRFAKQIRSKLQEYLSGAKKKSKTFVLIGCSSDGLKKHLESLWEPGMSWDNYGCNPNGKYWHIDHIIPCSMFDLMNSEEQECCFHWTNLQPLWAADNCSKKDRWIGGARRPEFEKNTIQIGYTQ